MKRDEVQERFQGIKVWKRGNQRAPHKPLLLLYSLGRLAQGARRLVAFEEAHPKLTELLQDFGPPRKSHHPEFPFWHLRSDDLWELEFSEEPKPKKGGASASRAELLRCEARGGFPPGIHQVLRRNPALVQELAVQLLEAHFPESLWEDLLATVGLDRRSGEDRRRRAGEFRHLVMDAYEGCCAVCGFDIRLGRDPVGLEAAHIQWHAYGGPDEVPNGLNLCVVHHKLFDRGAFTLDDTHLLLASELARGTEGLNRWLLDFHGERIRAPLREAYAPAPAFLEWHRKQVFRGPPRELG